MSINGGDTISIIRGTQEKYNELEVIDSGAIYFIDNRIYLEGNLISDIIYDKIIRTQSEFDSLVASDTWLDAKSVAFVGGTNEDGTDFEFTHSGSILIPDSVSYIKGFNAIIRCSDVDTDYTLAALYRSTSNRDINKNGVIEDISIYHDGGIGIMNCNNLNRVHVYGPIGSRGITGGTNITGCYVHLADEYSILEGKTDSYGITSCWDVSSCAILIESSTSLHAHGYYAVINPTLNGVSILTAGDSYAYENCQKMSSCEGIVTCSSNKKCIMYYGCKRIVGCAGVTTITTSNTEATDDEFAYCFYQCSEIAGCYGTAAHGVYVDCTSVGATLEDLEGLSSDNNIYDIIITSQDDFDTMTASNDWGGVTKVGITCDSLDIKTITIPSNVLLVEGVLGYGVSLPSYITSILGEENTYIQFDYYTCITCEGDETILRRLYLSEYGSTINGANFVDSCVIIGTTEGSSERFYDCNRLDDCICTCGDGSSCFDSCSNLTRCICIEKNGYGQYSSYSPFSDCTNLTDCYYSFTNSSNTSSPISISIPNVFNNCSGLRGCYANFITYSVLDIGAGFSIFYNCTGLTDCWFNTSFNPGDNCMYIFRECEYISSAYANRSNYIADESGTYNITKYYNCTNIGATLEDVGTGTLTEIPYATEDTIGGIRVKYESGALYIYTV